MMILKGSEASLEWWAIVLIVLAVLLLVGGAIYGVIYFLRNKSAFIRSFKYRQIDEQTALAQNQAEMEAW